MKMCIFRFKPMMAKEIIHNVLYDRLSTKEYSREEAPKWSKEIADIIREKMKSECDLIRHFLNFVVYR